jgi:hypothetical protein
MIATLTPVGPQTLRALFLSGALSRLRDELRGFSRTELVLYLLKAVEKGR